MINVIQTRLKDGQTYDIGNELASVAKSINSLAIFELGYGGVLTEFSPSSITVVTPIMNCLDTTVFKSDDAAVFKPLYCLGEAWLLLREASVQENNGRPYTDEEIELVLRVTEGSPLKLKLAADMVLGTSRTIKTVLVALALYLSGDNPKSAEVLIKRLSETKLSLNDLCAVYALVTVDHMSLDDALALAH